ncbi:protein Apa1p [Trichomonascus vanleenenianus]|uniref:protein Apa1p n=1 Tax=Trichomonascus vanleenenianus TaxID=2268995 RepID=UPI003ECB96BA
MFADKLKSVFESGVESGAVVFFPSESHQDKVNGVNYLYTVARALNKKPTSADQEKTHKPSPWYPLPEKELVVEEDFEKDYRVVLNKFAVVPRHFLLVTKEEVPQTSPLSPEDLAAAFKLLREANKSGSRHIGFYNSGRNSGASVPHKHIQFMALPEEYTPYPDELLAKNPDYKELQRPFSETRVPFANFIVPVPPEPTADDLGLRYATIMSRVLTILRDADSADKSHNIVFTEEWIIAVPRSAEAADGRSLNSTSTIGLLLAKSDEDLEYYRTTGPDNVLSMIGFPAIDVEKKEGEYEY